MRSSFLIAAVLICAVWSPCASAQTRTTLSRENIPHLPTDTLPTDRGDVRIVTFSDGTFRFVPADPERFRNAAAYGAYWDTVNLFAYRQVELRDLPETVQLTITDSFGAEFCAPATGKILSKYGVRGRRAHNGTDVQVAHGQPIYAAFDGIVRWSRWNGGGFGNLVVIRHPNGLETYYAHLSRRAVRADDWVRAGQVIGYGGQTGRAKGLHLHFETRYYDQSFDAERLIDFTAGEVRRGDFALRKEYFSIRSRAVEGIESGPDELLAANGTGSAYSPGDDTETAAAGPPKPEPVYHKIMSGDTLLAIARRYGTTTTEICRLNGITRNGILRIGKTLRIK